MSNLESFSFQFLKLAKKFTVSEPFLSQSEIATTTKINRLKESKKNLKTLCLAMNSTLEGSLIALEGGGAFHWRSLIWGLSLRAADQCPPPPDSSSSLSLTGSHSGRGARPPSKFRRVQKGLPRNLALAFERIIKLLGGLWNIKERTIFFQVSHKRN